MKFQHIIVGLFAIGLTATSCTKEKDDPVIPNEEEVITTLNYTLINQAGTDTVVMRFQDLDGDGGNAPVIIGGTLQANSIYTATIELLNELENPAENITEEVEEEAEDHQFFFSAENGLTAAFAYDDADQDGNPIGLQSTVTTTGASTGEIVVILLHHPNKKGTGVSGGDITNAGGETDIEVTFDVEIK